jgi:putative ABC transport system permease protein
VVVTRTRTLRAQVLATFEPERLAAGFVGAFAGLALLLAAVGLYGVVSHGVARRTKELGVRIALGAALGDVVWLVLRDTLIWLAIGTALGAGISAAAGQLIASQLFGMSAADPVSYLIATAILAGVALTASLVPAVRARRVDPVAALRAE